MMMNL